MSKKFALNTNYYLDHSYDYDLEVFRDFINKGNVYTITDEKTVLNYPDTDPANPSSGYDIGRKVATIINQNGEQEDLPLKLLVEANQARELAGWNIKRLNERIEDDKKTIIALENFLTNTEKNS